MPDVRVVRAPCIGSCHTAPAVEVGHHHVDHATVADGEGAGARTARRMPRCPHYQDFDGLSAGGGYAVLQAALQASAPSIR